MDEKGENQPKRSTTHSTNKHSRKEQRSRKLTEMIVIHRVSMIALK